MARKALEYNYVCAVKRALVMNLMRRSKRYILVIGIALVAIVILFSGLYLYQLKPSQPRHEENLPTPKIIPTPTLAPGQKAIYTFYIQATSDKIDHEELVLTPSDTGKTFAVGIGTLILLVRFRIGNSHISNSSPQAIFKNPGSPGVIHLPNNTLGAFTVYRAGFGTITVTESE